MNERNEERMQMKFCPECSRSLRTHQIERHFRPVCLPDVGGCGFIDYGRFTLGVGGLVIDTDRQTGERRVLLIQRNQEPNKGGWTLPGGFVDFDETADQAVVREIVEETGLKCRVIGMAGFRNRADPDVEHLVCGLFLGGVRRRTSFKTD